MAHIQLPEGLPGIRGPLVFSPATTQPPCDLVEALLRGQSTLTWAEREMIATYVSAQNDCYYCQTSHGSAAAQHLGGVQKGGKYVTTEDIERTRSHGATDKEIHDTVLIAAAFCMFNRYVDGLDTWQPRDPELYVEIGRQTAALGYVARDWKRPLPTAASK
jgi:AhpD family alkylhydroperoxidase